MVKSTINEIYLTIKTMLRYALGLAENQVVTVYQLGHYLADNILTKVCLAVAIDKGEEQQTYTTSGRTKSLLRLYSDHLKKYYPQVPDYDPDIKNYHDERNVYQHNIESFDTTMMPPRAKSYVELVERIMKMVGIIKNNEIITPKSLISQFRGYNYTEYQIKSKEVKYQTLYDLFKLRNDEDVFIKIEHAVKEIFNEFQKILNMKGGISHGIRYLHNSKWDVNINSFRVSVISKELGRGYGLNEPNQDIKVLESFLQYYRECCEKYGIEII